MSIKNFIDFFIFRKKLNEAKTTADESQKELDEKIRETRDASAAVIHRSREEIRHSRKIILVAEQAIRSMKQVERQH